MSYPATSRRPGTTYLYSEESYATNGWAYPEYICLSNIVAPLPARSLIVANARSRRPLRDERQRTSTSRPREDPTCTVPPYRGPQERTARRRQRGGAGINHVKVMS